MDDFDLDIDNYNIEDILELFNLTFDFGHQDLKNAKLVALKTHPDKSGLDQNIFLFFIKAYKVLEEIYYFRNKKKQSTEYTLEDNNKENEILLNKLNGLSVKKFNTWFNKMFDDVNIKDKNNGYGDWLKSEDNLMNIKVNNMNEFKNAFNKCKKECSSLILKRDINYINGNNMGSNLIDGDNELYSSNIFSALKYNDLKQVFMETVIPVTDDDFDKIKKYDSLEEYKESRNVNMNSISLEQSKVLLNKNKYERDKLSTQRAYKLIKQDEEINNINKRWWGKIQQLGN